MAIDFTLGEVACSDAQAATDFYMGLGFRMLEYTDSDDGRFKN